MTSKTRTITFWSQETRWFVPSVFFSCIVFFLLRKPLYILAQPGRVEDVDVLLSQALQYGWQSIFVLYNYYFHFVPRLVTLLSLSLLGIANVNLGMNLGAIIIAALCASFFAKRQFRFLIKNDLLRAICSVFFVVVPGVNEIFSNISSIQWFLNIFIMLFVSLLLFRYEDYEKKSKKTKYLYASLISISILSSAFSLVFLVPLVYIIIRELKKKGNLATISSYVIPTALLIFEAATLYITYTQQFKSSSLGISRDVFLPTANSFTISMSKIFYYDTPTLFHYLGYWMYAIPVGVISFVILGSIRERSRFEIYTLLCMAATLFWSSAVRGSMLDWNCLCGQAEERYFFFAVVFAFLILVKQFDRTKSVLMRSAFAVLMAAVVFNISSGFLIESFADDNWKYVTQLYDHSGHYHCYVGEVPHGWAVSIPCSNETSNSTTAQQGSTVTFTPPILPTKTTISSGFRTSVYGASIPILAAVSPIPNGGTIQFQIDGKNEGMPVTIVNGQVTTAMSQLEIGMHHLSAMYSGGPNFYPSNSSATTISILSKADLKDADLSGANLGGMDLSGSDMEGSDLSGANLQEANLSNVNLKDTNMSDTNLIGTDLGGANLEGANLKSANMQDANLSGSDIKGGDLRGAILSQANLTNANLEGTKVDGANFANSIVKDCIGCPNKSP